MKRIPVAVGLIGTLVYTAFGAFSDDFSNEEVSNTLWVKNTDAVSVQFINGGCRVANSDAGYIGFARHAFAENARPSTFTLSGKITLGDNTMTAGFACCVAPAGMATGYYISITENDRISINKIGSSGSGTVIAAVNSAYLTTGANELKISRKDGVFNIFCNGRFTTTFTDNDFTSGDIGLLVSAKTTAVFDDIVVTDSFEEGAPPTCFADDFSDGSLLGWDWFGNPDVSIRTENEALRITTGANQDIYQVYDLPLADFIMRVVVSHRGLSTKNYYGLFVCGVSAQTIPLAGFGINGGSNYGVFVAGETLTPVASTSIKGDPFVASTGDTTYYFDTLEVIKRDGVNTYLFVVNRDTLTRFTGVNFDVTGAGIFCFDSVDIIFDDFLVAKGENAICPVRPPVTLRSNRPQTMRPTAADLRLFDLSGRLLGRNGARAWPSAGSAGIYMSRYGKQRVYHLNDR